MTPRPTASSRRSAPPAAGWYAAFGLTVASELELPELRAVAPPDGPADVRIALGAIEAGGGGDGTLRHTADGDLLSFADCRLLVRDGREVVVEPRPGADPAAVRWCLLGAGVNFLLAQRDAFVVHASVVAVGGRAVAFVGPSGRGKSTTAAAFLAAGHDLLADDVAAIVVDADADEGDAATGDVDAAARVVPGFAAVKLAAEAVVGVDLAAERAGDGPVADKQFYRPTSAAVATAPVPLAAIYLLDDGAAVGSEPVAPGAAVVELLRETHTVATLADPAAAATALTGAGAVVDAVPVRRLTRPRSFDALPAVVAAVDRDLTGAGAGGDGR
jgi:hypothetical protein